VSLVGGSLRSGFQMPVPQGKAMDPGVRAVPVALLCGPHPTEVVSTEGVLGLDPVGDMVLPANEPLRGRAIG
jgi:hypothetical protein